MTKRSPVSAEQNVFTNSQQVDDSDLSLEQDYNNIIDASIINNHIGTGILPEVLTQKILFDSTLAIGFLDGVAVQIQNQPSDNNLGNQLQIQLTNSLVADRKNIKLCIIGLDFQSNLQYEIFYFKTNEIQIGKKHFTKIVLLLFNDFVGNSNFSFNLGGRLIITEAPPITLSRDPLMLSQNVEPNLFFRDFFVDGYGSVQSLIQSSLPLYNTDTLNIKTTQLDNKILLNGDVITQIGQKFIATSNNIQKITLLLSVRNLNNPSDLVWNGDLVLSIYPLQSNISCPSDIAPNLAIDFAPSNIPVAQLSINYSTLQNSGNLLDSIPQPIDFIFSNSQVAGGNVLTVGNYYAFAIKRSGAANKCDLLIAVGSDSVINSRITIFTGSLWVDIPEQDLWFEIWNDTAKVSDGQAYESGHGIIIPKTQQDPISLSTVDFSFENLQFIGNDIFRAVLAAVTDEFDSMPDQRTGEPVFLRKQFVPSIKLLNTIDITNLENTSDPLIIGAISDKNVKFFDSISALINSKLYAATMVDDELLIKIIDDPTDAVRFDTSVSGLITNLLNGDFIGAKIIPNVSSPSIFYKIASAQLDSMILGDVNGDGIIDEQDSDLLESYLNYNLNLGLPVDTSVIVDGYVIDGYVNNDGYVDGYGLDGYTVDGYITTTTFVNGYRTYTKKFNNQTGINFQLINPANHRVVAFGSDGILVANPNDNTTAQFSSSTVLFNTIIGLDTFKIIILTPLSEENYGGFDIISMNADLNTITIRKIFLTGDAISQMFRADIDGDFHITDTDGYLLESYIEKLSITTYPSSGFPGPTTNAFNKIGSRFNVIRFKLEKFVDRNDDYTANTANRSVSVHTSPDIFLSDASFPNHNFYTSPISISFTKQLTWDESLIVVNNDPSLVTATFDNTEELVKSVCQNEGVVVTVYASKPNFISDKTDFFVPNDLIIGSGNIKNNFGDFHKIDFEVGSIILEIPTTTATERSINLMDAFIADYTGDGRTRKGFPSMRFADCSLVKSDAISKNQLRFSVSVQSFDQINNGRIGAFIDQATGLLTLTFDDLESSEVMKSKSTKIQVNVFMKQGGFNNQFVFVDAEKVQNLLI